jgi:hypothetical protein
VQGSLRNICQSKDVSTGFTIKSIKSPIINLIN